MAKCWVVTSGEYSDYRVARVFTKEELAVQWVGGFNTSYSIEEYDLDSMDEQPKAVSSKVVMDWEDGTVYEYAAHSLDVSKPVKWWGGPDNAIPMEVFCLKEEKLRATSYVTKKVIIIWFPFYDIQKAVKAANEMRCITKVHLKKWPQEYWRSWWYDRKTLQVIN